MYDVKHILLQASIPYDLLLGADGAASAVRVALQQIMPAFYVRRFRHKQVYSTTQMTHANPAEIPPHAVFRAHSTKVQNLLEAICCFGSGICKCTPLRVTCIQLISSSAHCRQRVLQLSQVLAIVSTEL